MMCYFCHHLFIAICAQVKIKFSVRGSGPNLSNGVTGVTSFHYMPQTFLDHTLLPYIDVFFLFSIQINLFKQLLVEWAL